MEIENLCIEMEKYSPLRIATSTFRKGDAANPFHEGYISEAKEKVQMNANAYPFALVLPIPPWKLDNEFSYVIQIVHTQG